MKTCQMLFGNDSKYIINSCRTIMKKPLLKINIVESISLFSSVVYFLDALHLQIYFASFFLPYFPSFSPTYFLLFFLILINFQNTILSSVWRFLL